MAYLQFVISLFVIELVFLVILIHFILKIMHSESLNIEYKNLNDFDKFKELLNIILNIFKSGKHTQKYETDYKIINIFLFPFIVLFFVMIFSAYFGDLIFFFKPSTNMVVTFFKWIFKNIIRILIILFTVLIIGNTFYRYYHLINKDKMEEKK